MGLNDLTRDNARHPVFLHEAKLGADVLVQPRFLAPRWPGQRGRSSSRRTWAARLTAGTKRTSANC